MTSEPNSFATNKVIVVGLLDPMLVRDRGARQKDKKEDRKLTEVLKKAGRARGTGGRWEGLRLQVGGPYGGMFALELEIDPNIPGAALLDDAEAGALLAVEGALQLKQTFDGRYATDQVDQYGRADRGRPVRELHVLVSAIRAPSPEERRAGSAVWLVGEVAEPPRVARHPDLPAIQLASTILKVVCQRSAAFPGLPATVQEVVDVNVSIPTTHPDAERLFRQGNLVRVAGQLDARMEAQGGAVVRERLDKIDAAWAARKAALAGRPVELRKAEGDYRRLRQQFEVSARRYVLAGYVELVAGEPQALVDTYATRRAFVQSRREQQVAREKRVGQTVRPRTAIPVADTHQDAGGLTAIRPRQKVGEGSEPFAATSSGNGNSALDA